MEILNFLMNIDPMYYFIILILFILPLSIIRIIHHLKYGNGEEFYYNFIKKYIQERPNHIIFSKSIFDSIQARSSNVKYKFLSLFLIILISFILGIIKNKDSLLNFIKFYFIALCLFILLLSVIFLICYFLLKEYKIKYAISNNLIFYIEGIGTRFIRDNSCVFHHQINSYKIENNTIDVNLNPKLQKLRLVNLTNEEKNLFIEFFNKHNIKRID